MFVKGVQSSIKKTLRHWLAEHQKAFLEDSSQEVDSLLELQAHKVHCKQRSDTGADSLPNRQTYCVFKSRRHRVMQVEDKRHNKKGGNKPKSQPESCSSESPMTILYAIGAFESGEFDLDDTTTMNSVPFCRVCMNDNHRTSEYLQIRDLKSLIRTRNMNCNLWHNRHDGYSSNSSGDNADIHLNT